MTGTVIVTVMLLQGQFLRCELTPSGQLQHCSEWSPPPPPAHWEPQVSIDPGIIYHDPNEAVLDKPCKPGDYVVVNGMNWKCKP